uniref:Cytochrome c oxidase subunit 1 n=1 Tax=Hymenolepis diminuta TaxID=6216 RepID=A0A0R3SKT6_HYMDI
LVGISFSTGMLSLHGRSSGGRIIQLCPFALQQWLVDSSSYVVTTFMI